MIHDIDDIKCALRLSDDVSHHRIRDKLTKFRSKIRDNFPFFSFTHLCIGIVPPRFYDRIFECGSAFSLEIFIGKETNQIRNSSSLRIVHQRETPISKIILYSRSKYFVSKKLDHDIRRICNDHLFFIIIRCFEHIESHRTTQISRIKIHEIIRSTFWYKREKIFYEITMGIYHRDSGTICEVLTSHHLDNR